jgi:hypothetical protein
MENRIKEQQLMLFADRTSCQDFLANQFRLLLSSFAYVLVETLRREHLGCFDRICTDLAQAQVDTIRLKLFKVAGARGDFRAASRAASFQQLSRFSATLARTSSDAWSPR